VTQSVVWIPEANEDLLEARAWYDNIRPELGERFAVAVEATIEAIAEHPMEFPVVYRSRRRAEFGASPTEYSLRFKSTGLWSPRASTAGATQEVGKRGKWSPGNYSRADLASSRSEECLFITNHSTWQSLP
jgi:plasmid stabilization system protein ParE